METKTLIAAGVLNADSDTPLTVCSTATWAVPGTAAGVEGATVGADDLVGRGTGFLEGASEFRDGSTVGSMEVGKTVGSTEGRFTDTGAFEGEKEGLDTRMGFFEGRVEGLTVGLKVGSIVGSSDGSLLGNVEGSNEGTRVGDLDGDRDGDAEGFREGDFDGFCDGASVDCVGDIDGTVDTGVIVVTGLVVESKINGMAVGVCEELAVWSPCNFLVGKALTSCTKASNRDIKVKIVQ